MVIDMKHSFRFVCAAILGFSTAGFVSGCGEHDERPETTKKAVVFDEVPETLRDAAKKAIAGVEFNEAWQNIDKEGKLHSYEIRGRKADDGKIREVRVSTSGEILEME